MKLSIRKAFMVTMVFTMLMGMTACSKNNSLGGPVNSHEKREDNIEEEAGSNSSEIRISENNSENSTGADLEQNDAAIGESIQNNQETGSQVVDTTITNAFSYDGKTESLVLENDYLKFVMDPVTSCFTVEQKSTGKVWDSRSGEAEQEVRNDEKSEIIEIIRRGEDNSADWPYSNVNYSNGNDNCYTELVDDAIIVHFTFLNHSTKEYIIPPVITETKYLELTGSMEEADVSYIKDYYKKYDINNLREKDNKDELLERYPILNDEVIYVLREATKEARKYKMEIIFGKVGYSKEDYEADKALDTEWDGLEYVPFYNLDMKFFLDGSDLIVEIPQNSIQIRDDMTMYSLKPLNYFAYQPYFAGNTIAFDETGVIDYSGYQKVLIDDFRITDIGDNKNYGAHGIIGDDSAFICISEAPETINSYAYGEEFVIDSANNDILDSSIVQRYHFLDTGNYHDVIDYCKAYLGIADGQGEEFAYLKKKKITTYTLTGLIDNQTETEYDENGNEEASLIGWDYDFDGELTYHKEFWEYDKNGIKSKYKVYDRDNNLQDIYVYIYDENGNEIKWIKYSGDYERVSEYAILENDEKGNILKATIYNPAFPIYWTENEYNEKGEKTSESYYSVDYPDKYSFKLFNNGMPRLITVLGEDDQALSQYELDYSGNYTYYCEFDSEGNVIYEDTDPLSHLSSEITNHKTYEYDDKGNSIFEEDFYYGENSWQYSYSMKYDENGNMIEKLYYTNGDFRLSLKEEFDERGIEIKEYTYNGSGALTSYTEYEYDDFGNEVSKKEMDGQGEITDYTGRKYEYDENNNIIKESCYRSDGSLRYVYEYEYAVGYK